MYEIRDGRLSYRDLWYIDIDNHHKDCISVYLGDIGKNLPENEQIYWKHYNIYVDKGISDVSFQRDFLGIFAESNMIEHKFKQDYLRLVQKWKEKYSWDLFIPLSIDDKYSFDTLRVPLLNSQSEFDQLVLYLVKVLIDSLNEKELQKDIEKIPEQKGISKLENWFKIKQKENYNEHIQFLRDLQKLRSTGTGHTKGKSYEKIIEKFNIDKENLIDSFEKILKKADDFILYLIDNFL